METTRLDSEMNETQGVVMTVLTALATAVATLWKVNESKNSKAIAELNSRVDECDDDRAKIRFELENSRIERARIRTRLDACEDCSGKDSKDFDDPK